MLCLEQNHVVGHNNMHDLISFLGLDYELTHKNMDDYIDIGIFAANTNNKEGRSQTNPLYLEKYKLAAGPHTICVIVKGKPAVAGIDPYAKLIDRQPNDNMKDF